ncbi:sulfatase-like hydrolase/transferase [Arenibacter sp. ARW7G5Y1]|uniref:sulfatase-like hydrolase/transferase n=1 Tax=Arenibacter sp. ARW7G5Y1 TaxID=2135619 RepID=UPI000D76822D|nr:sulfatase-like hydrolase/transferase [Arenibacter sp. ARW7G5Y1]
MKIRLLFFGIFYGFLFCCKVTAQDQPNIVIIFTDDQGYSDLGVFGSTTNKTPRLDKLAKEGTRFTSFYAQHVCGPSRSALLTGRYPIRSKGWSMPSSEITFAELIREAGYQTACIGKWDVSNRLPIKERMPNAQGFDYYFGTLGANDGGMVEFYEDNKMIGSTSDMGSLISLYTDKAIDYLRNKRDSEMPFVLYLSHTMMHMNIDASESYTGKSEGGLYGDVVEEFDYETGRLLDVIDELDLKENTMVIYTTDNGPWNQPRYTMKKRNNPGYLKWKKNNANFVNDSIFWGESGPFRNGKGSCYEGGSRVPCIIRWPGKVPANKTSNAIFATIDLLPTFAQIIGFKVPEDRKIDGVDQTDLIFGKSVTGARDNFYYVNAMRKGKWKYLRAEHTIYDYSFDSEREKIEELYDLNIDPGETTNLASKYPEKVLELKLLLNDIGKDADIEVLKSSKLRRELPDKH